MRDLRSREPAFDPIMNPPLHIGLPRALATLGLGSALVLSGCRSKARPGKNDDRGGTRIDVASAKSSAASGATTALPTASGPTSPSAVTSASLANACIVVDENALTGGPVDLEGVLTTGTRGHPNGSSFTFFALALTQPRCVRGFAETEHVSEVQLTSTAAADDAKGFKPFVGKRVHIVGTAFPEHTAWHTRPVIVDVANVSLR